MSRRGPAPRITDLAQLAWDQSEAASGDLRSLIHRIFVVGEGILNRDGTAGGWHALSDLDPKITRVVDVDIENVTLELWIGPDDTEHGAQEAIFHLSVTPVK